MRHGRLRSNKSPTFSTRESFLFPHGGAEMTIAAIILVLATASTQTDQTDASSSLYLRTVKPILARRCVSCHGGLKRKAGLRLDTAEAIRRGGDGGSAVEAGDPEASLLLDRVRQDDLAVRMPPEGEPLKADEITAIRRWIESGAAAPADEPSPVDPRQHWAFLPPVTPTIPPSPPGTNPIDAILALDQQQIGVVPRPRAEPSELLRRVTIDLTGFSPSREEWREFERDASIEAYETAVDRLLASPRYGERWARHWMDVWRYSDWDGYAQEIRESRPQIWHWRDWIVESLNADLGYDRMVTLMIAADEAEPENDRSLRATGFLARNWHRFNRDVWLNNTVEHTSKAFLGLTVACARCHDHKYDPIEQTDYYKIRAIFEPHQIREDRLPIGPEAAKDGVPRVFEPVLDPPTYLFVRGDEKNPDKSSPIPPEVPAFLSRSALLIERVPTTRNTRHPLLRDVVRNGSLADAARAVEEARTALSSSSASDHALKRAELDLAVARQTALTATMKADTARLDAPPGPEAKALAHEARKAQRIRDQREAEAKLALAQKSVSETRAALRHDDAKSKTKLADAEKALAEATSGLAAILTKPNDDGVEYAALGPISPSTSSGRRLAFARWITSRQNPLAARVVVNHVWARHFGTPLVASMSDFGLNGKAPSNPRLLDFLATDFMDHGWSFKRLHRLIVTSEAYARSSSGEDSPSNGRASDPENRTYWQMNVRRLEAEAVRDQLLALAGSLDETLGGPDIDPEAAMTSGRRSLYLRHAQEKRATFLRIFDSPSAVECYRRTESVMPQQALALANSPLAISAARAIASRLTPTAKTDDKFVAAAFETILCRSATDEEFQACREFLGEEARKFAQKPVEEKKPGTESRPSADPVQRAREGLAHVLINHSDFVTIR